MIKNDYSGSILKIKYYLNKWNIDHSDLYIVVSDGSWSIKPYGYTIRPSKYTS